MTTGILNAYYDTGLASMPVGLSRADVDNINAHISTYLASTDFGVVAEDAQAVPRAAHGLHLVDPFFRALSARPEILDVVEAILQRQVYVHQFKVNLKAAQVGESWPWHQDFIFWNALDGIARPDLVNVAIHLSDTGLDAGPLEYYPGSHLWGNICKQPSGSAADWQSNVGRELTFQVCPDEFSRRAGGAAPVAMLRHAGAIDFFHPQLVHGSRENVSPRDRRLLIITYNAIDNPPDAGERTPRPAFLCARSFMPARASP